jgi:hypothetical protein
MLGYCSESITEEDFDDQKNTSRAFPSVTETQKWQPLVELLSRKWFSRCWIKQESALASIALVQVGPHLFPWLDLCHAIQFFYSKGYLPKIPGLSAVWINAFTLGMWSRTGMPTKEDHGHRSHSLPC